MIKSFPFVIALAAALVLWPRLSSGAEGETPANAAETNNQDSLRAYLLLQEQIHNTQLAIDRNRRETDAAAERNAEALAARVESLEKLLVEQRKGELETMQSSNRALLLVFGAFGTVALVMLAMGFFQWRTVHRLVSQPALQRPAPLTVEAAAPASLTAGSAEASSQRLFGTLDRLEQRLLQLEQNAHPLSNSAAPLLANGSRSTNGSSAPRLAATNGHAAAPQKEPAGRVQRLLEKGQSFLDLSEPEDALTCFEEALTLDPANAEALVKKGSTLERLQKPDEAIKCYDRAIAADDSFTIAYLHKGGLFNRLERFSEALECYKLALRTQK